MPLQASPALREEAQARDLARVLGTIASRETDNMRWLRLAAARLREINQQEARDGR